MWNMDTCRTPSQILHAAARLLSIEGALSSLLWKGTKAAHLSRGISPKEFVDGLYICQGTGWDLRHRQSGNNSPIFREGWFLDATKCPYTQLDLRTWLNYHLYGGRRILDQQDGNAVYARDQDAFFQFFSIQHQYTARSGHARHLLGTYAQQMRSVLRLRNVFAYLTEQSASAVTRQDLEAYYNGLCALLEPLCQMFWHGQKECLVFRQRLSELLNGDWGSDPDALSESAAIQTLRRDALMDDPQAQVLLGQYCATPTETVQWYRKAAGAADAAGLYHLGQCYERGFGTKRDISGAIQCYQTAAAQNHFPARYALGRCVLHGIGLKRDAQKAALIFEGLAAKGYAPAMAALAEQCALGRGTARNFADATELWMRAFHHGHLPALTGLGLCYYRGIGVTKDYRMAFLWFCRAAREGDAAGNYYLGECFRHGRGTPVDLCRARISYETAAVRGHVPAMYALAQCCADGIGGAADYVEALNWYCRAGAQGHRGGRVMADILLGGITAVPMSQRVRRLRALAKRGDALAAFELARCRQQGIGMAPDAQNAFRGYLRAAKLGVIRAPEAVGRCYEQGIGVEQNRKAAVRWYDLGLARGDTALMLTLYQRCLNGSARLTDGGICLAPPDAPDAPDPIGAAYLLRLAADAGSMEAANRLGKA